jgi:hypothetical protein
MRHILARVIEIKPVTAIPMDDKRVAVSIEAIREGFARLCATVSGAQAHFVVNMDEMNHQTWADATKKNVTYAQFILAMKSHTLSRGLRSALH